MSLPRLDELSERQQVLAVILMAGLLIFLVWFFALTPLNQKRRRLESDIEDMTSQLARKNLMRGESALIQEKETEYAHNRLIHDQWITMADRLGGFRNQRQLASSDYGAIDFKMSLFEVQQALLAKSRALNISVPPDIGMDEQVDTHEDARVLMLQLRTVEKLVDLVLDLKINRLRGIQRLTPITHEAEVRKIDYLEEYLVRLDFYGSTENLFDLLHAILLPDSVFTLKNFRIEALDPHEGIFNISVVMSALLFPRDPDEVAPAPKRQGRSAPRGA